MAIAISPAPQSFTPPSQRSSFTARPEDRRRSDARRGRGAARRAPTAHGRASATALCARTCVRAAPCSRPVGRRITAIPAHFAARSAACSTMIGTHNSAIGGGYGIEQGYIEGLLNVTLFHGDDLGEGVSQFLSVTDQQPRAAPHRDRHHLGLLRSGRRRHLRVPLAGAARPGDDPEGRGGGGGATHRPRLDARNRARGPTCRTGRCSTRWRRGWRNPSTPTRWWCSTSTPSR